MFWLPVLLIHPLAASSVTKNVGCFFYILPSCDSAWCTMYGFCWRNTLTEYTLTVVRVCCHPFNTDEVQCPGWMSVVPMKYLMSYSTCMMVLKNGKKIFLTRSSSRKRQLPPHAAGSFNYDAGLLFPYFVWARNVMLTTAIHLVEKRLYTSER